MEKSASLKPVETEPQSAEGRVQRMAIGSSRTGFERNIIEFEQAAQLMLRRMDVMLMTICGVGNEKDPSKRLEVDYLLFFYYHFEASIVYL